MTRDPQLSASLLPVRLSAERDFALGDLTIRPSCSEAVRDGRSEHVEPRVMQVLVALAAARGAVVSRDDLIRRCWDGRIVGEAAINRCMSRLRALADRGDGTRSFQVETIARVGYRLQADAGAAPLDAGADDAEDVPAPPRARRAFAFVLAGLAVAACATAFVLGGALRREPAPMPAPAGPSIAVLPFKDLSADADAAYFAAAIQDEILTRLAKVGSLKVISRTSAAAAAGKSGTLSDIARRLGVANVLEGSVQRSRDTVRVNVQLIHAADDAHLWAEDYDRTLDDVLSVENEIANSIATALAARITPTESIALSSTPTRNAHAYDAYLHALVLYHSHKDGAWDKAVVSLEQAVALDPDFALAWAMLARVESMFYFWERDPARRDSAHQALERALALAPDLPEAQIAHAQYRHYAELDYPGAERELRALNAKWPNDIEVLQSLAFVERRVGRFKDAIAHMREVRMLDPLTLENTGFIAETLGLSHRHAEAADVMAGMRKIWPDDTDLMVCEAGALQNLGRLDDADAKLGSLPAFVDARGDTLLERRAQYAYRRRFAEGLAWFDALRASAPMQEWDATKRATLELATGDFHRWSGDTAAAREHYQAAANAILGLADSAHPELEVLRLAALAYSGLGDRPSALRYADRLVETPLSGDAVNGAFGKETFARTLARLDDRDAAIAALARTLREPGETTPQQLGLDPDFDNLRGNPDFERLVTANEQSVD